MAKFKLTDKDFKVAKIENEDATVILKDSYEKFNEDILGLGKISSKSEAINALSVIFDLEGFTNFCKQIDPQLAVPEYLNEFLKWIFKEIKIELKNSEYDEGILTWADLPFMSKYLGDGILFLWNTEKITDVEIQNIVISMYEICKKYTKDFLPTISKHIISPPGKLRCGIARGTIYSVGNGDDFVGPCINMSARLQKLHSLSFCFSRRGINPENLSEKYSKIFQTKKVIIRGIGEDELVCIEKAEFEKLRKEDKGMFKSV